MSNTQNIYQLLLEINNLKLVFRNTRTSPHRKESTAEHSWSISMIVMILMDELKKEFRGRPNRLATVMQSTYSVYP